jgi:hypothetical protein
MVRVRRTKQNKNNPTAGAFFGVPAAGWAVGRVVGLVVPNTGWVAGWMAGLAA